MAVASKRTRDETTTLDEELITARRGHPDVARDARLMLRAQRQMLEIDVAEKRLNLIERKVLLGLTVASFIATLILGTLELTPGATASATSAATFTTALALRSRPRPAKPSSIDQP